jgi:hypothetical protein
MSESAASELGSVSDNTGIGTMVAHISDRGRHHHRDGDRR